LQNLKLVNTFDLQIS